MRVNWSTFVAYLEVQMRPCGVSCRTRATQELSQALQSVGSTVYQQQAEPPPEQAAEEEKPDEGTVEGEFKEV